MARHDLGVDARDLQTGPETVFEVGFDYGPTEDFIRSDAAVVATLRRRKAVVWPAERFDAVEEGVLLLEAEPRVVGSVALGDLAARGAGV